MACTPTPTATLYGLVTTYTPSTSFSQSAPQGQVSTIIQGSCIASGTISGSSVGCISSTQITSVTTVGGGQATQVPIVVSVPVTESVPTQTLFASCDDDSDGTVSVQSSQTPTVVTSSVLIQSTPPPSTVVKGTTTTLSDGSVVQTVVTVVTTQSPTAVYVPTTAVLTPTSDSSRSEGTNVAPIVGGVLGGFVGLVVIVGSLWWLCRKRRRWDDIFEKDDDDVWGTSTTQHRSRSGRGVDASAEPRPYQYGLVGRVVPPAAAGEPLKSSRYGSVSEFSGTHSRQTSLSATPLLQGSRSSRPSTSASIHTQSGSRLRSTATSIEMEPRSLSTYSTNAPGPLLENYSGPPLLANWAPNTDDLAVLEPNHSGSPVPSGERRILQIVNDGPSSPTETITGGARHGRMTSEISEDVIMHTDGGPLAEPDVNPPAYSR